jgi:hypothetical protein
MDYKPPALEEVQKSGVMPWLEVNADELTGRLLYQTRSARRYGILRISGTAGRRVLYSK